MVVNVPPDNRKPWDFPGMTETPSKPKEEESTKVPTIWRASLIPEAEV